MKAIKHIGLCLTVLVMLGAACLCSCSQAPSSTANKDKSVAERDLGGTTLGMLAKELSNGRPESESGFLLLDRGRDALAWRLFMADQAERTLDAQYFLWKDDRMGRLFIQRLMDAAERGVRVRVLIDDSMTESDPKYLAKFARIRELKSDCTNLSGRTISRLYFAGSTFWKILDCSTAGCITSSTSPTIPS